MARRLALLGRQIGYVDRADYYEPPDPTTFDASGHPAKNQSFVSIKCAFNDTVARLQAESRWNDVAVITEVIAEIQFNDVVPRIGGQFVLRERSKIPLKIPVKYEILAIREQGIFGFLCALKQVAI
jgi:hypothetical protein